MKIIWGSPSGAIGALTWPGAFRLAVTGGTGRYQDARGYAAVVPSHSPKVTVHLTP